jgi:uncharacterized membrane protein
MAPLGHGQTVTYEVRVIQPSQPGGSTSAFDINRAGLAVGNEMTSTTSLGFIDNGAASVPLPPLPGFPDSIVERISVSSYAYGSCTDFSLGPMATPIPTCWDRQGNPHQLRLLPGHVSGYAVDGTGIRAIVGGSSDGTGATLPVLWRYGVVSTLPRPAGALSASATAINHHGFITAVVYSGPLVSSAYTIDGNGTVTEVPDAGLFDVNAANEAVGIAPAGGPMQPAYYRNGQIVQAPMPSGFFIGGLLGVNRNGTGVGFAAGPAGSAAIITDGTTTQDLNALLDPVTGSGITLFLGQGINNAGQIAGSGMNAAMQQIGVILTPIVSAPLSQQLPRTPGPRVTGKPLDEQLSRLRLEIPEDFK